MKLFYMDEDSARRLVQRGELTISVYGLGHVGSPILAAWLLAGVRGIGVDLDEEKVSKLSRGESPVDEPCLGDVFKRALEEGRLTATTDGAEASRGSHVKIIAVPTLIDRESRPDLRAIESAAETIAYGLKQGDMVILESSVPPGTTRGVLKSILERISGLEAGKDFGLAYSPERISEGRALRDIVESYPKVVGGIDERSTRLTAALYSKVARKGVITLPSELAAEFEKLAEGVYRDVNIALANELAGLCRELGIDYDEVRLAANSQPFSHLHKPGTGVGGLCIPIYPEFLRWTALKRGLDLPLVSLARDLNRGMPSKVADLVEEGINRLKIGDPKLVILGLAFRGDVSDSRLSPTYDLVRELLSRGISNITVHDPLIKEDEALMDLGIPIIGDLERALRDAEVLVLSTDHSIYKMKTSELFSMGDELRLVVDGRHIIEVDSLPPGALYVGVGRPWISG